MKNLSVKKASELSGMSEQFIRVGLQQGRLDFGYAVKISGDVYSYYISPIKFAEKIGIKLGEGYDG